MLPDNLKFTTDRAYELSDGSKGIQLTFGEDSPRELADYSVTVVADTIRPAQALDFLTGADLEAAQEFSPQRITTVVARFPRVILAEFNTHRVFSRNSASSRARSIKVVIADVMENPYVPLFTENQRGMVGALVSPEVQAKARAEWLSTRDAVVAKVLGMLLGRGVSTEDVASGLWRELTEEYYQKVYLDEQKIEGSLNLHKQNVNRLLEPFVWQEAVVTSTEWTNYLELRDHDEADPAIHAIGRLMSAAFEASTPRESLVHAPFAAHLVEELESSSAGDLELFRAIFGAANYTAGAAAQVSYRPVGSGGLGADPAKLSERLLSMKHLSPFEHAAVSADWLRSIGLRVELPSNLSEEWIQHRSLIAYLEKVTGERGLNGVLERLK